jgi:hypothetical protein
VSGYRGEIDSRARLLGLTPSAPRARTGESEDAREQRRAEREARKAKKAKVSAPILNPDAEVEDTDIEEAIASIQSIPKKVTKSEEEDVMASILAAMQGRQK